MFNLMKVKALVSLFRPIAVTVPSYAGASLSNVPRPHSFSYPITEERFRPPTRLPHPEDVCLSGINHIHALQPFDTPSKELVACPQYRQYELEAHVTQRQPPTEPWHVVQQAAVPHTVESYYLIEAQKPYLHEKPFLSLEDPYRR